MPNKNNDTLTLDEQVLSGLTEYFMGGDVAGAIKVMGEYPELHTLREKYVDIFEREHYIRYNIPDNLNAILLAYQQYYRDVFYLGMEAGEAERNLFLRLQKGLNIPEGDEDSLVEAMESAFTGAGYHVLCGKTNGYYGPYVWKNTVPTTYTVELTDTTCQYTVNILKGFISRSWMDYVTFGKHGTGGWASPDGTINCVETAYDFESEAFKVSLLKHEAQHVEDMKRWPEIESWELEYRAKLVELIFTEHTNLLPKFIGQADSSRTDDSHAVAACRIAGELGNYADMDNSVIREKAAELFARSSAEMERKYL